MIHLSYKANLQGLKIFVSNVAPVATKHDRISIQETRKKLDRLFKVSGIKKGKTRPNKEEKINGEKLSQIYDILKGLPILTSPQVELLYRSSFVMLLSYFDYLISDLIRYFYRLFPGSLSDKELSITLNELKLCGDLTEAMDYIVNKEVDKVLYDNLEDQKKYFKNYLKIDVKEEIIDWNKIKEAIERRNIIVHNNSKINRRYLENVDLSFAPEMKKDLKEGNEISINENYFNSVYDELLIAGIILLECCSRKWKKDDINQMDQILIEVIYDLLLEEKWSLAERLGLFSKQCDVANERNRLYLDINYCQSLKWQGKKDELEEGLKKFDMSTLSPKYVCALSALKGDKDYFYKNIEKAIIVDNMKEKDFMEWPLFRELREDREYKENIRTAFMKKKVKRKGDVLKKLS